jgi:hypothetical protein
MAKKKKTKEERIKEQLKLVKKLKEKKRMERESFEKKMKAGPKKGKTSLRGGPHDKFTPGHHGNR